MNFTDWANLLAVVVGFAAASAGVWAAWGSSRTTARQEAAERQRLNIEILGQTISATLESPAKTASAPPRVEGPGQKEASPAGHASAHEPRDAIYDQLLINDYALGLTQARVAFNVSMAFSVLGGIVLVLGISLAIFRADTGGQVAGAAITSAAGVLTSGLSQLFRGQSTKALKHLESQAVELRKDVRDQTNATTAQRLLEEVADSELRSHLQAALILEFTGAKLPNLVESSRISAAHLNGHAQRSENKDIYASES